MATTDIFTTCMPAIRANIDTCGSVTACDLDFPKPSELDTMFIDRGDYIMMEALFQYQLEANMCQARQSSLFNYFMANKVDMSRRMSPEFVSSGLYNIKPFIMRKRKGTWDNNYWLVSAGEACDEDGTPNPAGTFWHVHFASPTDIPVDIRWFNAGERVFITGRTEAGSQTNTAWIIVSAAIAGSEVSCVLDSQNDNSFLADVRLTSPVEGVAIRGTANVSDFEEFCATPPGLINNTMEPLWVETIRDAFCEEELYEQWRNLALEGNPLYKNFYDLPTIEYNRQAAEDFKRRWVNTIFYSKPLENQDLENWMSLQEIEVQLWDWDCDSFPDGQEVEYCFRTSANRCVGRKANVVGIYEKLAECERVHDAQGAKLNLPAFFRSLYKMYRIREATGHPNPKLFEIAMPSPYAVQFQTAMLQYFKQRSEGLWQLNMNLSSNVEQSPLGFRWRTFRLDWPDLEIRIITDTFFDDELAMFEHAAAEFDDENLANLGRRIWILDWPRIRVGVFATNRVVNESGDLKTLAKNDPTYMCVMKVTTKKITMTSTTYTVDVECPAGSLLIENLSGDVPEPFVEQGNYDSNPD